MHFLQDRSMKPILGRKWLFATTALALSGIGATADDASGERLVQARFDQLVPTSYPIVSPTFDRLIQTIGH